MLPADYTAVQKEMVQLAQLGGTVDTHHLYVLRRHKGMFALCNYSPNTQQGPITGEIAYVHADCRLNLWEGGWWHLDGVNKAY